MGFEEKSVRFSHTTPPQNFEQNSLSSLNLPQAPEIDLEAKNSIVAGPHSKTPTVRVQLAEAAFVAAAASVGLAVAASAIVSSNAGAMDLNDNQFNDLYIPPLATILANDFLVPINRAPELVNPDYAFRAPDIAPSVSESHPTPCGPLSHTRLRDLPNLNLNWRKCLGTD